MSRRRLSKDERALWRGVTRSIAPLAKSSAPEPADEEPVKSRPAAKGCPKVAPVLVPQMPPAKPAAPAAPAALGRRARKRIARGRQAIDARLDLHGMTQAEAHDALTGFLRRIQARGGRLVLIITGKGSGTGERGVLKRMVPLWLRAGDLRGLVVGFENAGIGHGGEGALYVSLRRPRAP
jgi:DNA-nicking Smr family endonuclease